MIRLAVQADAHDVYRIYRERFEPLEPTSPSGLRVFQQKIEMAEPDFPLWVYESNERIEGWVSLGQVRNSPALVKTMAEVSYYVSSGSRNLKIGTMLVEFATKYASQETQLEWIHAYCGKSNSHAVSLWKNMGAQFIAEFPPVNRRPDREVIVQYSLPVTGQAEASDGA